MTDATNTLLIATGNRHKLIELADVLSGDRLHLLGLQDLPGIAEPEEGEESFAANARLKAVYYAAHSGYPALADDSGLAVDALGGAPGVISSRYAGGGGDEANNQLLLVNLRATGDAERRARFVCALCLALPDGSVVAEVEGHVEGVITDEGHGPEGFGYDPLFRPDGHRLTFGQLPPEIKRGISHRTNALRKMRPHLRQLAGH